MRFARILTLSIASAAVLLAACGGNVVVDHGSSQGTGGTGGTSNPTTGTTIDTGTFSSGTVVSTGTVMTTGTGGSVASVGTGTTTCDCATVCNDIATCFQFQGCEQACNSGQFPAGFESCICSVGTDCGGIQKCAEMAGTGGGPGTGGGGTGGGVPQDCSNCVGKAAMTGCAMQANDCEQHQSCTSLFDCEQQCDFDPGCVGGCRNQFPSGVNRLQTFLGCAVCNTCNAECSNTDLFNSTCAVPD